MQDLALSILCSGAKRAATESGHSVSLWKGLGLAVGVWSWPSGCGTIIESWGGREPTGTEVCSEGAFLEPV